jgi:branched-subunit amino acid transport protein
MEIWLTIIAAGVLTFLTRFSFIAVFGRWQPPALLQRALRFVPPAVLTAIIVPELVMQKGQLAISLGNLRLLAGLVAALVAWRTRNILWTIAAGMACLYLLQWLIH